MIGNPLFEVDFVTGHLQSTEKFLDPERRIASTSKVMGLRFSPSERRLYWSRFTKAQLAEQVDRLPSTQRSCSIGYDYNKIVYVHDLVRADMRAWLDRLSLENLQYLFIQYGRHSLITADGLERDFLLTQIMGACIACGRVEGLLSTEDKASLRCILDSRRISYRSGDSMVVMIDKLVRHRGHEKTAIFALRDLQQAGSSTITGTQSRSPTGATTQLSADAASNATARPRPASTAQPTASSSPSSLTPAPVATPTPVPVATSTPEAQRTDGSRTCIICYEHEPNAVFYPCGHQTACFDCATKWVRVEKERLRRSARGTEDVRCPVCRHQLREVIKTYGT